MKIKLALALYSILMIISSFVVGINADSIFKAMFYQMILGIIYSIILLFFIFKIIKINKKSFD